VPTPDHQDDRTPVPVGELGYADAVAELEAILDGLETEEVDVDVLAGQVRRAADLLAHCRRRIDAARFEVEQVVASLRADEPAPDESDDG
jgi:exodeoxyribonuclease VII small subunit